MFFSLKDIVIIILTYLFITVPKEIYNGYKNLFKTIHDEDPNLAWFVVIALGAWVLFSVGFLIFGPNADELAAQRHASKVKECREFLATNKIPRRPGD